MNNYNEVMFTITPANEIAADVLSAMLAEIGFESFVHTETGLTAYAPQNDFDSLALQNVVSDYPLDGYEIKYEVCEIEGEDWNAEWEKNYFQPIIIDDRCVIHSSFHTDVPSVAYDIVIDPKMAFGTGYHQTTCHMLRAILDNEMQGKSLLDMGCGTALLAILARMRGASPVVAVDIDEFAYENAKENIVLNETPDVDVRLGGADAMLEGETFDYIVANINRNILLADIMLYSQHMHSGSKLFISGFYTDDMEVLRNEAERCGLYYETYAEDNRWAMMTFYKK